MRKIIALAIAAAMLLVCFCAVAEETVSNGDIVVNSTVVTDDFGDILGDKEVEMGSTISITVDAPEGYATISEPISPETLHVSFVSATNPTTYDLMIAYSEEFGDYILNDLTDEELAQATEILADEYNDPTVSLAETGFGTKVIVIDEQSAESDYVDIVTIYHGYFIQVSIFDQNENITDEEVQNGLAILTSLAFVVDAPVAE